MPVKRALRLEEKENITPSKRPALDRTYSPLTGTCFIHHTHTPPANSNLRENANNPTVQEPQTDKEKFQASRSKIEASVNAFLKARQQIEKTLTTEGGSELSGFFKGGSSDLQAELCKNRELCALVEARLDGIDLGRHRRDGSESGSPEEYEITLTAVSRKAIKLLRIPKINPELRSNSAPSDVDRITLTLSPLEAM